MCIRCCVIKSICINTTILGMLLCPFTHDVAANMSASRVCTKNASQNVLMLEL